MRIDISSCDIGGTNICLANIIKQGIGMFDCYPIYTSYHNGYLYYSNQMSSSITKFEETTPGNFASETLIPTSASFNILGLGVLNSNTIYISDFQKALLINLNSGIVVTEVFNYGSPT